MSLLTLLLTPSLYIPLSQEQSSRSVMFNIHPLFSTGVENLWKYTSAHMTLRLCVFIHSAGYVLGGGPRGSILRMRGLSPGRRWPAILYSVLKLSTTVI